MQGQEGRRWCRLSTARWLADYLEKGRRRRPPSESLEAKHALLSSSQRSRRHALRCVQLYAPYSAALRCTPLYLQPSCPRGALRALRETVFTPQMNSARAHARVGAGLGGCLARCGRRPSQLRGLQADSALRPATADSVNGVSSHLSAVNRLVLLSDPQGGGAAVRLLPCPGHAHDMSETCPAGGAAAQLLRSLRSLASRGGGASEATDILRFERGA